MSHDLPGGAVAEAAAGGTGGRPLAGRRAWIITDGKAGMDVQVKGVADALGLAYEIKHVAPKGAFRVLAPWAPVAPAVRFGQPGSQFPRPFPELALATGRLSIPYIRALMRRARGATYCVVLQDPRTGPGTADLIWVPAHDRRRGPNVITTLTAPHSFSPERLAGLRRQVPAAIAALPRPRVAVVLGGPSGAYRFEPASIERFGRALAALGEGAGSFLVTPSRRTPHGLLAAAEEATRGRPRLVWDGNGSNPYADYLAHADVLVVTADSVNMTGEACATGRPVYVFEPGEGTAKLARFHEALRRHGATRLLTETVSRIESWTYGPLDSAHQIAAEIERRWLARQRMLPGLVARGEAGGASGQSKSTEPTR